MHRAFAAFFMLSLPLSACSEPSSAPDCLDGKCDSIEGLDDDDVPASPCDGVLIDRSGRKNSDGSPIQRVAGRLGDRIARTIYQDGSDCPADMRGIMAKLESDPSVSCGTSTAVVAEDAQLSGEKGGLYRAVTSHQCSINAFEVLFSNFGLAPDNDAIPAGLEIMAFDETAGVFNYYKETDGQMAFFGNSHDFISKGPGGPGVTSERGCANCHTGGGPIMKELNSPWTHWADGAFATPGADELVTNREEVFGRLMRAEDLENFVVEKGYKTWNEHRIDFWLERGDTQELLRPLFCPVEINLEAGSSENINGTFVRHSNLVRFFPIKTDSSEYMAVAQDVGVRFPGHLSTVPDTFLTVDRSEADRLYANALVKRGIVDEQFVKEVAYVDMTRPVFSDDRCDLLQHAPSIPADELDAAALRDGFIDNLAADGGAPADMLRRLFERSQSGSPLDIDKQAKTYGSRCNTRLSLLPDLFKLRSLGRKLAYPSDGHLDSADGSAERPVSVLEFPQTMPEDDIVVTPDADLSDPMRVHPKARLHPETCALVDDFVAPEF
jgi:hypothetical protein